VRAACRLLQQKSEAVTQAAISRVAGLTRQTVAIYKHVFNEVLKPAAVAILKSISSPIEDVKYGVHQVTAGKGNLGSSTAALSAMRFSTANSTVSLLLDG
jgi:hypothetical protein